MTEAEKLELSRLRGKMEEVRTTLEGLKAREKEITSPLPKPTMLHRPRSVYGD